jgi:hypothetical protein
MAHAESGKHDATAFVFGNPPSSRSAPSTPLRGQSSGLGEACLWAASLAAGTFGNAVVFLDPSALARWSSLVDRPWPAWLYALAGFVVIGKSTRLKPAASKIRRLRILSLLALAAWAYHLLYLRFPWLVADVAPADRLSVYSGKLSQTWANVPLLAFVELVSVALLIAHASLFLIVAATRTGLSPESGSSNRLRRIVVLMALIHYALSAAFIVALATGRL